MTKIKMRTYEVKIQVEKTKVYHVDAEDDAGLVRECNFSHLQKQSSNVKYVRTDNEFRKMSSWKEVSNAKSE